MSSSDRARIEAARIEAARDEAIQNDHEVMTITAAAYLYGCDDSNIRHALRRGDEDEAVRLNLVFGGLGGRGTKFLGKRWADGRWRDGAPAGYEDRLRSLRERGLTFFWAGMWLLLGVEVTASGGMNVEETL